MSYLQLPRLYFFGTFRAAPSTINNIRGNWNPNRPVPPAALQGAKSNPSAPPPAFNLAPADVVRTVTIGAPSALGDK